MIEGAAASAIETSKIFEIAELDEMAEVPMEKIPEGLKEIEVKPNTDIYDPVAVKDININCEETRINETGNSCIDMNEKDNNQDNRLTEVNEEEKTEYNSTYEERMQQTPKNNGEWEDKRGESEFRSNDEKVNKILQEFGLDGITYKDGIPDFSEVSKGTVEIDDMTDSRPRNFTQADEAIAKQRGCTPQEVKRWREEHNYVWHERNDMKTMDKAPYEVNATFGHLGGVSEYKKANEAGYEEDEFDE